MTFSPDLISYSPRNIRRLGFVLFVLALVLRLAGVVATHQYQNLERYELERTALSLALNGVYGNPYAIPTGPTGHVSPGYTVLLAFIFRVFGTGVPGEIVKEFVTCCVTALHCALLPWISLRLGFSWRAAVISGVAATFLPLKLVTETQGDWESAYAALAFIPIVVLTARLWSGRDFSLSNALRNGLAWGLALLVSWTFSPLLPVLLVAGYFYSREEAARYASFCAVTVAVIALCLLPWIVRNWFALHAFVPGRTNVGIELAISNNDFASPNEKTNFVNGLYDRYHPLQNAAEAAKVLALGEIEYNRRRTAETRAWISAHPARFAQLTLGRAALYWFYPDPAQKPKTALLWLRTLLAFYGLVLIWQQRLVSARLLTLILLVVPLPSYLVHVSLKHSYLTDWLLTLLAGVALGSLLGRILLMIPATRLNPALKLNEQSFPGS